MYLRTVLNTERLSSEITEYLTIVGRGFKHFSPDLIRIGYFYLSERKIDPNNFYNDNEEIIIRVSYQSENFDCYVLTKSLAIDNIPFGDLMYLFMRKMISIEAKTKHES